MSYFFAVIGRSPSRAFTQTQTKAKANTSRNSYAILSLAFLAFATASINSWGQTTTSQFLVNPGQQAYAIPLHDNAKINLSPYLYRFNGDSINTTVSELLDFESENWKLISNESNTENHFFPSKQNLYRVVLDNPSALERNILIRTYPSAALSVELYSTTQARKNSPFNTLIKSTLDNKLSLFLTPAESSFLGSPEFRLTLPSSTTTIVAIDITTRSSMTKPQLVLQSIPSKNAYVTDNRLIFLIAISIVIGVLLINSFVLFSDGKTKLFWLASYSCTRLLSVGSVAAIIVQASTRSVEVSAQMNVNVAAISAISLLSLLYCLSTNSPNKPIKPHAIIGFRLPLIISITTIFAVATLLSIKGTWGPSFINIVNFSILLFTLSLIAPLFFIGLHQLQNRTTAPSGFAYASLAPISLLTWIAFQDTESSVRTSLFDSLFTIALLLEVIIINTSVLIHTLRSKDKNSQNIVENIREEQRIAALAPIVKASRHDLRAPISDIIGLSELVLDSHIDQQQRTHLLEIQNASRQALDAINKIFSIQYDETKDRTLVEPFELAALLADCTQHYGPHLDNSLQEIIVSIQVKTPEHWSGDHEKIRQLMMHAINLFSTDSQLPILYIEVKATNNNQRLNFLFSMESLENQSRVSGATTKHRMLQEDFSSKLAPLRSVISSLQGKLETIAKSTSFQLKIGIPALPLKTGSRQLKNIALLRNMRVIVIDDNPRSCDVIANYLKQWSIEAFTSQNFEDATAQIRHQSNIGQAIDLALIDFIMPSINGIEVARRFRSDPDIPANLSIVLMSNASQLIDSVMTKNYGVHRFLDKPVLSSTLQLVLLEEFHLTESLRNYSSLEKPFTANIDKSESLTALKSSNTEEYWGEKNHPTDLQVLLVEDNPISAKITSALLNKLKVKYDIANCCEQARKLIKEKHYSLALLDCKLRDGNGDELAQELLAKDKIRLTAQADNSSKINLQPILIVALTAYDANDKLLKNSGGAFHQHISKPITILQLTSLIDLCSQ